MTQANITVGGQHAIQDHTLLNARGKWYRITVYVDGRRQTGRLQWVDINRLATEYFTGGLSALLEPSDNRVPSKIVLAEPLDASSADASLVDIFRNLGDGLRLMQEQSDYAQEACAFMQGVLSLFRSQSGSEARQEESDDEVELRRVDSKTSRTGVTLENVAVTALQTEVAQLTTAVNRLSGILETWKERPLVGADLRFEQARQEAQEMAVALEDLRRQLDAARESLRDKEQNRIAVSGLEQDAQARISELEKQLGEMEKERASLLSEQASSHREEKEALQSDLDQAMARVQELHQVKSHLEQSLSEAQERHLKLREAQKEPEADLIQAKKEVDRSEWEIKELQAQIAGLKGSLHRVQEENTELQKQERSTTIQIQDLQQQKNELQRELAQAEKRLQSATDKREKIDYVQWKKLQQDTDQRVAESEQRLAILQEKLDATNKRRDQFSKALRLGGVDPDLEAINVRLAEKDREISFLRKRLKSEKASAQSQLQELREQSMVLQNQSRQILQTAEQRASGLQERYKEEKLAHQRAKYALNPLRQKVVELQQRLNELVGIEASAQILQEKGRAAHEQHQAKIRQIRKLQEQLSGLQGVVVNLTEENDRLHAQFDQQQAIIQRQGKDIERLQHVDRDIEAFVKENHLLRDRRLAEIQKAQKKRQKLELARAQVQDLQERVRLMEAERANDFTVYQQAVRQSKEQQAQIDQQFEWLQAGKATIEQLQEQKGRYQERISEMELVGARTTQLQRRFNRARQQLQQQRQENARLKVQVREAQNKTHVAQERLSSLHNEHDQEVQEFRMPLIKEMEEKQAELSKLRNQKNILSVELTKQTRATQAVEAQLTAAQERLQELEVQHGEEIAHYRYTLTELEQKQKELQIRIDQAAWFEQPSAGQVDQLEAVGVELEMQVAELTKQVSQQEATLEVQKSQLTEAKTVHSQLVQKMQKERTALSQRSQRVRQRNEKLMSKLEEMRKELRSSQWLRQQYWKGLSDQLAQQRKQLINLDYRRPVRQMHLDLQPLTRKVGRIQRRAEHLGRRKAGEEAEKILQELTDGFAALQTIVQQAQDKAHRVDDSEIYQSVVHWSGQKAQNESEHIEQKVAGQDIVAQAVSYIREGTGRATLETVYEGQRVALQRLIEGCQAAHQELADRWQKGNQRLASIMRELESLEAGPDRRSRFSRKHPSDREENS